MRITLVIPSLERGGAERVMSILASAWSEQGREVTLLTLNRGAGTAYPLHAAVRLKNLDFPIDPARTVLGRVIRQFPRILALRRAIRGSCPDVVVCFLETTSVLALVATRGLAIPVIVSERVDPRIHKIGSMWRFGRQITYRWADALVCQTASTLSCFQRSIRVEAYVIPNPIEAPPGSLGLRQSGGGRQPGHRMVAMGRLVPQKGFDLLLEAYGRVAPKHPDWSVTILGQGPLRDELVTRSQAMNLAERVHFPGEVSDPFAVLRSADLFVLSSRYEGFPNALCEAMACGLAVISFDCPAGPAEIIRHGLDGILVPPEDVAALASALDRLMNDANERRRLSARAPEVLSRFNLDKVLLLWEQVFTKVCK